MQKIFVCYDRYIACISCIPSRSGSCSNLSCPSGTATVQLSPIPSQPVTHDPLFLFDNNVYENSKKIAGCFLEKAYVSSLLSSDRRGKDCVWFRHWSSVVSLRSFQYDLPIMVQLGEIL